MGLNFIKKHEILIISKNSQNWIEIKFEIENVSRPYKSNGSRILCSQDFNDLPSSLSTSTRSYVRTCVGTSSPPPS